MSRIYWDTMLFVYHLENDPVFEGQVRKLYARMIERGDQLLTSTFTLGELLVAPLKKDESDHASLIREFLPSPEVELVEFDVIAAEHYARVRATTGIRPVDAIHLACAARARTDLFVTNDQTLQGKNVPGIQFVLGLDVAITLLGSGA